MSETKSFAWTAKQLNPSSLYQTESSKSRLKSIFSIKTLLALIVVLQVIMIVLIINPSSLWQQFQNQQVISQVKALTQISSSENPVIAQISNADALREENIVQEKIYKDAQNGDYVLGYSDKLIIFRKEENKIIYNGDTPSSMLSKTQQQVVDEIIEKTKEAKLIPADSAEQPQVSVISDSAKVKAQNPTFYALARNNDVVAIFSDSQVIVLYNLETKSILNSGKFTTSIQKL